MSTVRLDTPSRSDRVAGTATALLDEVSLADWLQLIRAEYLELPGLHLTRPEAQRLWGLDGFTCGVLLETLVDVGFLRRTRRSAYVRAD